jgi:mannose-1-phosphate guanylyltransferase
VIRYDRTRFSVVIVCDCGWSDVGVSNHAAWSLAADHESRVHPGTNQVREAARKRESRSSATNDEMSDFG